MRHIFIFLLLGFISAKSWAETTVIDHIEPLSWWIEMKNPRVELMVHGKNIASYTPTINYKGVKLEKIEKTENVNYLFLTLNISPKTVAGKMEILFKNAENSFSYPYQLNARSQEKNRVQGISPADFIYLLMPDRFANGDKNNDNVPDMLQPKVQRDKQYGRHGGDIQGVIDHLDYLQSLGITAIWMNPEIENNQPAESYHGYAATDLYKIDPRLGTNDLYAKYVNTCHQKGMKVIKDVVFNHVGNETWWYKDLPSKDWVHQWENFTRTNYRAAILLDPYASQKDKNILLNGWFDKHMPDLNQQNAHLATYLIQNSIWWVEFSGLDGYRIDTYPYPDASFMARWHTALQTEYPTLGVFGECWMEETSSQAFFARNVFSPPHLFKNRNYHKGILPMTIDFQFYYAAQKAFNEDFGWDTGLMRLYYMLVQDFMYEDAYKNVLFLDNHDVGRYASTVKNDVQKMKMAIALMLTTRGIPSIYYGTEIMMPNDFDWGNHDKVREEFPGGWDDHVKNKFTSEGRNENENEIWNYIAQIANYRKAHTALQTGKLTQFVPENGTYTYFRYDENEKFMIVLNTNKEETSLETARFEEMLKGISSATNILTNETTNSFSTLKLAGKSASIWALK